MWEGRGEGLDEGWEIMLNGGERWEVGRDEWMLYISQAIFSVFRSFSQRIRLSLLNTDAFLIGLYLERGRGEEEEEGGGEMLQPCVSALVRRVSRWAMRMGAPVSNNLPTTLRAEVWSSVSIK